VLFTFQGATTSGTIAINSASAILDMNKCVFDNGTGTNTYCVVYTGTANPTTGYVSIRNSVFYGFQVYGFHISSASTLTGTQDSTKMVLEDNFFCVSVNAASAMVYSPANPVTLRRNIFNECRSTSLYAIAFVSAGNSPQTNTYPIEDNIIYNCALGASIMVRNNKDTGYACSGNVIFRCTTVGMLVAGSYNSTIEGFRAFGNTSANMIIGLANIAENFDLDFVNCAIAGEGSYASQTGIGLAWAANVAQANAFKGAFYNCTFGNLLGASDAHTTADINFVSSGITQNIEAHFDDCELASTVKILNQSRMTKSSKLAFRNFNITDNDHRTYYQNGIIQTDTTITRSSPRSARFTPSSATLSTDFSSRKYALKAGQSATVGCYIRTSVIGDGAVYNGSLPQIILKKNYAAGIATDQVIGTATVAAAGAWELVSDS
jgi:hypothetical protein